MPKHENGLYLLLYLCAKVLVSGLVFPQRDTLHFTCWIIETAFFFFNTVFGYKILLLHTYFSIVLMCVYIKMITLLFYFSVCEHVASFFAITMLTWAF